MSIGYLDILDEILTAGTAHLSPRFAECQTRFVTSRQLPNGGFPGRRGAADLYYTDFALRILTLFSPKRDIMDRVAAYLTQVQRPVDIVECFSLLHINRLLERSPSPPASRQVGRLGVRGTLESYHLPTGGFVRHHGHEVSAYATFLAALCYEMLDVPFPAPAAAVDALCALQRADGGFADIPGGQYGQTNATAAALAFLVMQNAYEAVAPAALAFLLQMQAEDGGLKAHPAAPASDLLSTFTGAMTLSVLDALTDLDLPPLTRFLRHLTCPTGGFRAGLPDEEPDIEYTYYGIATMALLHAHVARSS